VYASVSKLIAVSDFRIQLSQSPLLTPIAGFVTWFIPLIELLISVLLVTSRWRFVGLMGSFGLMLAFTLYIAAILQFSENIPCSCGGVLQQLGWTEHLIFNTVFTLLALVGILLEFKLSVSSRAIQSETHSA
jgi:hypothetical protein